MNRPPNKARKKRRTLRPWTFDRVKAALPYLRSVVQSVREHRLQVQVDDLRARRLTDQPGRPDRDRLIAQEEAVRAVAKEEESFEEAVRELSRLDVYVLDPVAGQALVPFIHHDQLAWLLFDLFADGLLDSWRYHEDPMDVRRPLSEIAEPPPLMSFTA